MREKIQYLLIGSTVVAVGLAFALFAGDLTSNEPADRTPVESGKELLAILFVSSTCPGANNPQLPEAWNAAQSALGRYADARGYNLVTAGVALDLEVEVGNRTLDRFGEFDEVHSGRQYLNVAAVHYMDELYGSGGLPQVVLVERTAHVEGGMMDVEGERILVRKIGPKTIISWAREAWQTLVVDSISAERPTWLE